MFALFRSPHDGDVEHNDSQAHLNISSELTGLNTLEGAILFSQSSGSVVYVSFPTLMMDHFKVPPVPHNPIMMTTLKHDLYTTGPNTFSFSALMLPHQ